MARSVTYNGITQFRPGGLTKVDASALAQIGLATNGIIGLIGEADGGEPSVVTTIDDPALSKESFRTGPLADAIRAAFDPSGDPRIPGGAFRVLAVKTNQGTQATLTLYALLWADTTDAASTASAIKFVTNTSLTVDELKDALLRIGTEERTVASNTADTATVSSAFSSTPVAGTTVEVLVPVVKVTSRDYGLHTNQVQFEWEPGASSGQAWTTLFDKKSQVGDDIGGKSYLQLEYVGQSSPVTQETGTADGASTPTSISDASKTWTVGAYDTYFVEITLAGTTNLRKISATAATTLTVATLSATPATEAFTVKTGMVRTGTAIAGAASTISLEPTFDVGSAELVGMVVYIKSGTGAGQSRAITSHSPGAGPLLTVDQPWATQPDNTSVYELRYVTQAYATIAGSQGKATSLKTWTAVNGAAVALDKTFTFTTGDTLEDLVTAINANADYLATVPAGINDKTFLVENFDYDQGNYQVDIRNDKDAVSSAPTDAFLADGVTKGVVVMWDNNFRADVWTMISDITEKNQHVTATRITGSGTGAGQGRPLFTGGSVGSPGDTFKYLTGGTRGVSSNTNFQAALDLLLQQRCNFVVPLIVEDLTNDGYGSTATWTSVAAQLNAHVKAAGGIEKTERGGIIGFKGTMANLISEANKLNQTDIQIVSQRPTILDVSGVLKRQPEWAFAVMAAGMRAGAAEVGEPLTHKFIATTDLWQDSSWDPLERTDANQLIQAGVLFAENIKGKGIRWVRDITTHVLDDNLAFMEGSVRDVVRFVSYGLRTLLEDRFTGVKASPANAEGIKDTAAEYLELARSNNIIVDSSAADGSVVKAYHNLRVTISGDIATIRVEIFPVVGINFQLNEIFLQLPTQAA